MYQIVLYEYRNGPLVYDFTFIAEAPKFQTNKYGFGMFTFSVNKLSFNQNAQLYRYKKIGHIEINYGAKKVYEGRLEDINLTDNGLNITAYGYIRSFTDLQCTDLWSTTDYAVFKPINYIQRPPTNVTALPDAYTINQDDQLYMALNNNVTVASPVQMGALYVKIPEGSTRTLALVKFRYDIRNDPSASVSVGLQKITYDLSTFQSPSPTEFNIQTSLSGIGATHIVDFVPTASAMMFFTFVSTLGLYAGETGDIATFIKDLRYGTTTSISGNALYADEIVKYIVSGVRALNVTQLSPDFSNINSPGVDITDFAYEDITGLEVVDMLTERPDNLNRLWECKVFFDGVVRFQPRGTGARTWYIDIGEINISRTFNDVSNRVRVKYGGNRRTEYTSDLDSIQSYGIIRESSSSINTESLSTANLLRDTLLEDRKDNKVQSTLQTRLIRDEKRAVRSAIDVRSGDVIIIGNLPPALFGETLTTFIVDETEYDLETGIATIVPDKSNPVLDVLLARIDY